MYVAYQTRVRPKRNPTSLDKLLNPLLIQNLGRYMALRGLPVSYTDLLEHSLNRLEQICWQQTFYEGENLLPTMRFVVHEELLIPQQFCPEDGNWYEFAAHIFGHAHFPHVAISSPPIATTSYLFQYLDDNAVNIAGKKDFTLKDYSLLDLSWYTRRFPLPNGGAWSFAGCLQYSVHSKLYHTR